LFAGTINEFVTGLMQRAPGASSVPPLAIIPGGTGNSIATSMGLANVELAGVIVLFGCLIMSSLTVGCVPLLFFVCLALFVLHSRSSIDLWHFRIILSETNSECCGRRQHASI
jgi:hypothetical protein